MVAPPTEHEILDVNRRYHDVAAASYDAKWGISFGEIGQRQVLGKLTKLLGPKPGPFARSLEIGAGTGYFSLNLLQTGVVAEATCTDISPGMLAALEHNARELGLDVETAACDAAQLPFEDESFDLVLGHAVLHHLPDLDALLRRVQARAQARRHAVLRRRAVALGRPHRALAQAGRGQGRPAVAQGRQGPARPDATTAPPTRTSTRSRPSSTSTPSSPPTCSATAPAPASPTSACAARSCWPTGSAGSTARSRPRAEPKDIPRGWIQYAYNGYILLQRVDRKLLEPRLPPRIFYNLMLAARKPG